MTPTEWVGVLTSAAVFPRVLQAIEAFARGRLAARKSERPAPVIVEMPKSSSSADKMRAVAVEFERAETVTKINEVHEALAGKDPLTRGYIIPEHLRNQTMLLKDIRDESARQTQVLQRIANSSPPPVAPRPGDTRYRGGGE